MVLVITKQNNVYVYKLNNLKAHFKKLKKKKKFAFLKNIMEDLSIHWWLDKIITN